MKKYLVLLVWCLLLISCGYALELKHSIEDNVIVKEYGNSLSFELEIINATKGMYNVFTLSDVYIKPDSKFSLDDEEDWSGSFTIEPMNRLLEIDGTHIIAYTLNQKDGEKFSEKLVIKVLSLADAFEIESGFVELGSDEVDINIRNLHKINMENLSVRFSSVLFDSEKRFDLGGGDVVLTVPISGEELKKIRAGVYLVEATFFTPDGEVVVDGNVYFNEKKGINTFKDSEGFIFQKSIVTKVNSGNTVEDVKIEISRNIFTRFFTSFDEEPLTVIRDGFGVKYVWSKKLVPSEVYEVTATTNYLYPLLVLIVLVLIYIGLRRFFKTNLVVEKSVTPVRTKNGEFALRVRLSVRAKRRVENVVLVDRVPKTVKIYKKFGISNPDEVDVATRALKWHVGDLDSGEERLYTYVVYSRVGYVGKFVLPPAVSRFKYDEEIFQVDSNSVFFLAEQTSTED